jgi:thiamine-monophosphate kinase
VPNLSELGERKIIGALRRLLDHGDLVLGFEDDCAAIPLGSRYLLITTDVVNRATHIPAGSTPEQVGWYTAACNLSDIAAKGGRPLGLVVAMTLPRRLQASFVLGIARGADRCCRAYGARFVGGDTKEGPDISLAGTAVGVTAGRAILRRRGARVGDVVAVTGAVGRGGWAFRHLRSDRGALDLLMCPRPRVPEGQALAASRAVTSCMDISDGLAASLAQLTQANGTTFEIAWDHLPLFPRLRREPMAVQRECALYMGGDYELLFTARPRVWPRLQAGLRRRRMRATAIGAVAEGRNNILLGPGGTEVLEARGWEHFR